MGIGRGGGGGPLVEWVKTWDFLTRGHAVLKVGGSNPGRGTIVWEVLHPTRQLARFFQPNMPFIVNCKFV